jgi:uncharacterized protein (TIGR02996 family)
MTYDEAFLQAVREAPNDDAPRLIYADWLEEHGQADRAEFIRIQCRLARSPEYTPNKLKLRARVQQLLRENWNSWVGPLQELVGRKRDRYGESWLREEYNPDGLRRFRRGFVDALTMDAQRFLDRAEDLVRLVPLRELRLWGAGRCAYRLSESPFLRGLAVLAFTDYWDAPLTADDARILTASPYLSELSVLSLARNALGDEGVAQLALSPYLYSLTSLDLTDNGLSDHAARSLAASPYLINLRTLNLSRNELSRAGVAELLTSLNLRQLTRLEPDYDDLPR